MSKGKNFVFERNGDTFTFECDSTLVLKANPNAKKDDWRTGADRWHCVLTQSEYGNIVTLDFWTGIGLRKWPKHLGNKPDMNKVYFWEHSIPVAPDAHDVLYSLASDSGIYLDCRDSEEPLDGLAETLGIAKPSEVRKMFEGCKESHIKLRNLLKNTGIPIDELTESLYE